MGALKDPESMTENVLTRASSSRVSEDDGQTTASIVYLTGSKLYLIVISILLTTFLSNLETPIVATSLISISDDLGDFQNVPWMVTSYLLGFTGFMVIIAKSSDLFGRKLLLLFSLFLFLAFSAACAGAQTLPQLIIFRAFQGVGAGGGLTMSIIIATEVVPESKYATIVGIVSLTNCLGLVAGPLVGGAINDSITWRWIFLITLPPIAAVLAIVVFCLPLRFPYHGEKGLPEAPPHPYLPVFSRKTFARVDYPGVWLLLLATMSLVAALEEAGVAFAWSSDYVISLLVVSVFLWMFFLAWEYHVTSQKSVREPVLPWRLVTQREPIGLLLVSTFAGVVTIGSVFLLPQSFQILYGASPLGSGVRLVPFNGATAVGAVLASVAAKKKIPPIWIMVVMASIQIIGFALLATVPTSSTMTSAHYGYEVIAGFGCGANTSIVLLTTPFAVQGQDRAVAMSAMTQFRYMGGALGVAIAHAATYGYIKPRLSDFMSPERVDGLLNNVQDISFSSASDRIRIEEILSDGYRLPMSIFAGFAGLQVLCALLTWRKPQIRV